MLDLSKTYRIFPTDTHLTKYKNSICNIQALDEHLFDREEVGEMYMTVIDETAIHLFECEIQEVSELSSEEIVKLMFTDLYSYREFIEELVVAKLNNNPVNKAYWEAWFKGEKV